MFQGYPTVAKAELGTKRICPQTGRKFYDLGKNPVISPYTGEVVPIAPIPQSRSSRAAAAAVAPLAPEVELPETAEVELGRQPIGRAHGRTPFTSASRMPSSA